MEGGREVAFIIVFFVGFLVWVFSLVFSLIVGVVAVGGFFVFGFVGGVCLDLVFDCLFGGLEEKDLIRE